MQDKNYDKQKQFDCCRYNITSGTKELDRLLLTNFENIFGLVVGTIDFIKSMVVPN